MIVLVIEAVDPEQRRRRLARIAARGRFHTQVAREWTNRMIKFYPRRSGSGDLFTSIIKHGDTHGADTPMDYGKSLDKYHFARKQSHHYNDLAVRAREIARGRGKLFNPKNPGALLRLDPKKDRIGVWRPERKKKS